MNYEDIIRMAREAGFEQTGHVSYAEFTSRIERFATLVAAAEREACAQIVQSYMENEYIDEDGWHVARDIFNDIRRKET